MVLFINEGNEMQLTGHDKKQLDKIKPNTKIRIHSPDHNEYVQKLAFEAGYRWVLSGKVFSHTDALVIYFDRNHCLTHGGESHFSNSKSEEITIEMPDTSIESRVLAEKINASDVLSQGAKHLSDRAATYDSPEGERSMGATVEAFESITGHALTEEQGWLFMVLLKSVRSQQGDYKLDNYEDGAAYFALMAESASQNRNKG